MTAAVAQVECCLFWCHDPARYVVQFTEFVSWELCTDHTAAARVEKPGVMPVLRVRSMQRANNKETE